jgi:chloramphenicol 3-O-phosphotransferase
MSTSTAILPRAAAVAVERALRVAPVVVLMGARQTGKTTLVRSLPLLVDRPYLTFDDFDLRVQAEADPEAVVARAPAPGASSSGRALTSGAQCSPLTRGRGKIGARQRA